jgi:acid stress-induced BolA-like protein IbaG/YrbA
MDLGEIKSLLESGFSNALVEVTGEGSHFNLRIVSDDFEGLRAVKKQQMVYAIINDKIADGSMHAVNMQLFTEKEWAEKNA